MDISINNIKQITHQSFQDLIYDKTDTILKIKDFFDNNKNPLGDLIYNEFNFYWNDLFSKQVLEHSFVLQFPDIVKPNLSIWILNWKEYIQQTNLYHSFDEKNTVRELDIQSLQDEADKLKIFFKLSKQKFSKNYFLNLENSVNLTIPHYYNEKETNNKFKPFKNSFISSVFYFAKISYLKNNSNLKDDLIKFFQSYYSYFHKSKESGRSEILSVYYYGKNFDSIVKEKIKFITPKTKNEQLFMYNLNISSFDFADALNEVCGISSSQNEDNINLIKTSFQTVFTQNKTIFLDEKLPLNNNIKTKKIKI